MTRRDDAAIIPRNPVLDDAHGRRRFDARDPRRERRRGGDPIASADDGAATRERANASTLERGVDDDRRPATTGDARGEARLEATTRVDRATRRRR